MRNELNRFCLLTLCLAGLHITPAFAQDVMKVERIRVVPENVPILNIHVDAENIKWIANARTLYKVDAKDHAIEVPLGSNEMSLLQLPGGNHDIRWQGEAMTRILGNARVTTASYDQKQKVLWIGTNGYGVFKLRTEPSLQLIEQLHIDNSKLRSDFINSIYISDAGKVWIATEDGAVSVDGNQWIHHQRYFNILRIRGRGKELWAIGDDLIWLIDPRDNWTPIPINRREIEGDIHDIAVDPESRVWIASNVMTSYNITTDRHQRFGPGQYFTSQFVNYVAIDEDATIWVGTNDKGLYIIEKESTITVNTTIEKYLACAGGGKDAELSVRAIGGKPPYTFRWGHGVTGERITGLAAGKYQLTVTDTEGSSKATSVEVPDPFIRLTTQMDRPETDAGTEDGAVSVKVSGGAAPYSYEWYSGIGESSLTGIQEGVYGVTVTDAAGCTATATAEVLRNVKPLAVSIEAKQNIRCPGESSAIIAAAPSGGRAPFTYAWSNGITGVEFLENVASGKYTVTVTDKEGSTSTAAFTVNQPETMVVNVRLESAASTNMNNGVASLQVTGGRSPYQYLWDNGETTQTATTLAPRKHNVTVTDAYACTVVATVDVTENVLPLNASMTQTQDLRCFGDIGAALRVDVRDGKSPYRYQWSQADLSGSEASGLKPGEYVVTVTDQAGNSAVLRTTVREPAKILVSTIAEAPTLTGTNEGHAIVRAEGGTGKLRFLWDNGETGSKTESLSAGIHTVTVTDESGCTSVGEVNIIENILAMRIELEQTAPVQCAGDASASIEARVEGGKEPYSYAWSTGSRSGSAIASLANGTYAVTVTDVAGNTSRKEIEIRQPDALQLEVIQISAANTNTADGKANAKISGGTAPYKFQWSSGETTQQALKLAAGVHRVTVTDVNGCTIAGEVTVREDIEALQASVRQVREVSCPGEASASAEVSVQGGKAPFTMQWSDDSDAMQRSNLRAGTYIVTISDAAGQKVSAELIIKDPAPLNLEVSQVAAANTNVADGKANAKISGGKGPYTYLWSSGETTQQAVKLPGGVQQVTVTDANGCSTTSQITLTEDIDALQVAVKQTKEILCTGEASASAELTVSGGKSPFSIEWNDASDAMQRNSLRAGTYSITITDAAGQNASAQLVVKEPVRLSLEATVISPANANTADGKANAAITGGTAPYQFQWSSGETTQQAVKLGAGTQSVTVTDANGCSISETVEIKEDITSLQVAISQTTSIDCAGTSEGVLTVEVSGGKSPFTYLWDDQSAVQVRKSLRAGEYAVTVTDAAGQKANARTLLKEPAVLKGEIVDIRSATHERIPDGKATAQISGGTGPFAFAWDNGETTQRALQLGIGSHSVTITDAKSCSVTLTAEITPKLLPELTAENLEKGEAVRMEKLQFDADSTNINASSIPTLEELYAFLYDNPTIVVEVGGHTNGVPDHEYCDQLSTARAKAVADYIIEKGIEEKRIIFKGYGKRQPIASNQTPEGRRRNQRVEVKIVRLSE